MSSLSLDTLPTELLFQICSYIKSSHERSLRTLSCVCKTLRFATAESLFSELKLTGYFLGQEEFKKFLAEIPEFVIRHVRHLIIDFIKVVDLGGPPSYNESAFLPLIPLFGTSLFLRDFSFHCPYAFPILLLKALHEKLPSCRLHLTGLIPKIGTQLSEEQ
jgi:hypothetical protein